MFSSNLHAERVRGRDCWVGVELLLDRPRYQSSSGGLLDVGEDITFQPKGPISLTLSLVCVGEETLYGIEEQTARRPTETSPSCSCSFNTSEQYSDHEENSNILVNSKVSTKTGPCGLS
ncbi:hypothetical protein VZT92_016140 [Zoarces viviparus]|uniref:Uncharacterized protein n=1 Tax=Zoarces viviparus TaxID=48416 RepID=A0AAW1EVW7_ZOAVI